MRDYSMKKQLRIFACVALLSVALGSYAYANRPKTIEVTVDGQELTLFSAADTVEDALKEAGYQNLKEARSSVDLKTAVSDHMKLSLTRKKVLTYRDGESSKVVTSYANQVGDLLEEMGADYDEDDVIQPARMAKLEDGMTVELDHIEHRTEKREEKIPYQQEVKESKDLVKGKQKTEQKGQNGLREIQTELTLKNGQVMEKKELSNLLVREPVKEIIVKGTKVLERSQNSSARFSLRQFMNKGIIHWGGYKYTFYSQRVLPGGGLRIPGRHVNQAGYVCDGNGYIVLAGSAAKGTVYPTPFGGPGKIYDRGTFGNHLDVYIR